MGEDRTRGHSRPDNTDTPTELRTRLELAERAQATLEDELRQAREVLAQERQRREQAEAERDELRRQLGGVEERRPEDADSEARSAQELHQRLEEVRESPERAADEGGDDPLRAAPLGVLRRALRGPGGAGCSEDSVGGGERVPCEKAGARGDSVARALPRGIGLHSIGQRGPRRTGRGSSECWRREKLATASRYASPGRGLNLLGHYP